MPVMVLGLIGTLMLCTVLAGPLPGAGSVVPAPQRVEANDPPPVALSYFQMLNRLMSIGRRMASERVKPVAVRGSGPCARLTKPAITSSTLGAQLCALRIRPNSTARAWAPRSATSRLCALLRPQD